MNIGTFVRRCRLRYKLPGIDKPGDDLILALARQIVSGEEDTDSESLEDVFAQARDVEAASDEFLVDEGWKLVESLSRTGCGVEPELEPLVEVHSNGVSGNVYVEESVVGVGNGHDLPRAAVVLLLGQVPGRGTGAAAETER